MNAESQPESQQSVVSRIVELFLHGNLSALLILICVLAGLTALVVTFLVTGVFEAFINTPINVEMQRLAPTEYRARVFAVLGVGTQGIVPIGFGVMGLALDAFPAHFIALGVTIAVTLIVFVFIVRYSKVVSSGLLNYEQ